MGGNSSKYNNNNKPYDESISLPSKLRKMKQRDDEMKKKNNKKPAIKSINYRGTAEIFQGGQDADVLNKMALEIEKRKKQQEEGIERME
uniref:Uncharacterized protein n=1 Tax=viral metagenome TaxID=1070528 RepID=A0A6C0D0I1_9ZZZZ